LTKRNHVSDEYSRATPFDLSQQVSEELPDQASRAVREEDRGKVAEVINSWRAKG
jgi:hypothetical protein